MINDYSIQRDRHSNAHIYSDNLQLPHTLSWRLCEIRQPPTCLCTTSQFLSNTTIDTFQESHVGWHLATTWGKYHRQIIQDRQDYTYLRHGHHDHHDSRCHGHHAHHGHLDRQDRQNWHLNLTFQVTCGWQLSQFLRCFLRLGIKHLSKHRQFKWYRVIQLSFKMEINLESSALMTM